MRVDLAVLEQRHRAAIAEGRRQLRQAARILAAAARELETA